MRSTVRSAGWLCILLAFCLIPIRQTVSRDLTFEDRVRAQEAIERVYWAHRIWPAENRGPKPPLSAVMPEEAIQAKVEDYLRKSNALQAIWGRPITGRQLQAETARMASSSRHPGLLKELFAALDDDPFLIAECLSRPQLADRLVRSWFLGDDRFHAGVRARAEEALAKGRSRETLELAGARYEEHAWTRADPQTPGRRGRGSKEGSRSEDAQRTAVSQSEWDSRRGQLLGRVGHLNDDGDTVTYVTVLENGEDRLRLGTYIWPKQDFNVWWAGAREGVSPAVGTPEETYPRVAPTGTVCTDDTWAPNPTDATPDPRIGQSGVWTGTEFIVWGGKSWNGVTLGNGARYDPLTDTWLPMSRGPDSPTARSEHTAVWTGTEMIVWGGAWPTTDSGARYDPQTDTWHRMASGGAAVEARYGHTAVWADGELIVWGGLSATDSYLRSGGRYSPITDTWRATGLAAETPEGRVGHTALWTGAVMAVWGGRTESGITAGGGRYDPAADRWALISAAPDTLAPRMRHTAVWTGIEMIVWGGSMEPYTAYATGGRYDPASDTWSATSTGDGCPVGRFGHTAVWSGSEMIVWGGETGYQAARAGARYDPIGDRWSPMGDSGYSRWAENHSAVWTGSEMLVACGSGWITRGLRYSPATDAWLPMAADADAASPRAYHSAVWTGSEMLVWGGMDWTFLGSGSAFTPATNTWTSLPPAPADLTPRARHTAVWTGTEMIVWGGWDAGASTPGFPDSQTGARYNPASQTWRSTSLGAGVPGPRRDHSAIWTGSEMIVWGGALGSGTYGNGSRYHPDSNTWTAMSVAGAPAPRFQHSTVWTGTQMVIWGGRTGTGGVLGSGGKYSPTTNAWSPTTSTGSPTPRRKHTAVWTGSEMIVWGGFRDTYSSQSPFDTGGRYDPMANSWRPTGGGPDLPQARGSHSAVWTDGEMVVWGGENTDTPGAERLYDTGARYRPQTDTWRPIAVDGATPQARSDHPALWSGSEMIVWGGWVPTASGGTYCVDSSCAVSVFYRDGDGDGFGDPLATRSACSPPLGYVTNGDDCADDRSTVHPEAAENCNGVDDDCDGVADENVFCEDGDACTWGDVCVAGTCEPGRRVVPKVDCDDGNRCTLEACDFEFGCWHMPRECSDGNPHTIDSCDPRRGCVFMSGAATVLH